MKNYKVGIILGTLSIISTLMIVRLPIGDKMVAIGFLPGMILSFLAVSTLVWPSKVVGERFRGNEGGILYLPKYSSFRG